MTAEFEDRFVQAFKKNVDEAVRICIPLAKKRSSSQLQGFYNHLSTTLIEQGVSPLEAARFANSLANKSGHSEFKRLYSLKEAVFAAIDRCINSISPEDGMRLAILVQFRKEFDHLRAMPSFLKEALEAHCPFFQDPVLTARIGAAFADLEMALGQIAEGSKDWLAKASKKQDVLPNAFFEELIGTCAMDFVAQYKPRGPQSKALAKAEEKFYTVSVGLPLLFQKCLQMAETFMSAREEDAFITDEELEFVGYLSGNEAPALEKIQSQVQIIRSYKPAIDALKDESYTPKEICRAIKKCGTIPMGRILVDELRESILASREPLRVEQ